MMMEEDFVATMNNASDWIAALISHVTYRLAYYCMLDDANGADFRFQFRYGRRAVGRIRQQQIHRYLLEWYRRRRTDAVTVLAFDPNDFQRGCTA